MWGRLSVLLCLCALLCVIEQRAVALDPEQSITQYSLTQWGHRDGLSSTAIYAIAQTPDGFLWLGTSDGVVRFDGLRFIPVPLSGTDDIAFGPVKALIVARTGAMWIGTETGKLVRMEGRSMKIVVLPEPIVSIRENADSTIRVETSNHVLRFHPESMEPESGDLSAIGGDQGPKREGAFYGPSARKVSVCQQCTLLGLTASLLKRAHLNPNQIRMAMRDKDENLWVATAEGGIVRVAFRPTDSTHSTPEIEHLSASEGLSNDSVWDIFEDREHNLWIATQNGLDRLRDDKIATMTRRTGLLSNEITSLASVNNGTFAGSSLGLNRITSTHSETVLRGSIFSLARSTDGSLLFATPLGVSELKDGKVR